MKLETIRSHFLNYFGENEHSILPSSPLVPHNDPSLMFTNAGMVQFKDLFTGKQAAPEPPRATTSQKCVRAGGKHNDLDNVGYTARHHTFFEMLGNFSFGDYFKEEAIHHAWNLLTKDFGLSADKLYATVYHTDDEAFDLWKKIAGLPDEKIMRIPTSDNFWAMGDTGPCGPCSEVFYDHGEGAAEGKWALDANGDDLFGDRYIEIWNLVFMQYEQVDAETRIDLPKPCVDTGMGLERMAAVLQGKHNNYDIDLFADLIADIEEAAHQNVTDANRASFNILADHIRSSCFLMADGVLPSNEGRGYVLRRIMRRAMRHAHILGTKEPLMHKLVPSMTRLMGGAFGELHRAEALMKATLKSEEERFRETLGRGLKLLDDAKSGMGAGDALAGDVAFKLYDTYGFPVDLTQDILRGENQSVDMAGFEACMAEQKARARAAWKGSGDAATAEIWHALHDEHGATEFLGYTQHKATAYVNAIVKDGAAVDEAAAGDAVSIILNQTPCYGESGGQVGDTGTILLDDAVIGEITDTTQPVSGLHAHAVTLSGVLKVGDTVDAVIDATRRQAIRANHSATHLLHAVLRKNLGEHITQKGSLVDAERLRFDISHPQALTPEELRQAELNVNRLIWGNTPVRTQLMKPDDAIEAGAMALFGEKYGDEVRVLSMGADDVSVELCGGTHVEHTGEIGLFKIVSESAIAAGVRRIEAVTLDAAFNLVADYEAQLKDCALQLTATPLEVSERVSSLLAERKATQKELAEVKKQLALGGGGDNAAKEERIGEVLYISRHLDGLPPKELRGVALDFLKGKEQALVAVTANFEGKGSVVVALSDDLAATHKAADYVQIAVETMGGKGGGGKPNLAQGGGPDGAKGADALVAVGQKLAG